MAVESRNIKPDYRVKTAMDAIWDAPPAHKTIMLQMAQGYAAVIDAGLRVAKNHSWMDERLRELDPLLRLRWDLIKRCWCVDRFIEVNDCWMPVVHWFDVDTNESKMLDLSLIEALYEGDTWRWPSPEAYLEYKRAKAARVRAENARVADQKILAAIDRLSRKGIQQFIDVERALHTGETIVAHGADLRFLDRGYERTKKGLPVNGEGATCLNPGMDPLIYHRKGR